MKTIVYIFSWLLLFGLSGNLKAQEIENPQEELIDNEWYLTKLVIQEEDYPYMDTEVSASINFDGYYNEEGIIEGYIETIFYEWDWAEFHLDGINEIYSAGWQTMALPLNVASMEEENIATPYLYFQIFWMNGPDIYDPVHHLYQIFLSEEMKVLIIIDDDGNEAHFQNLPYLSVDQNEFSNLNIYPNPLQESFQIENLTEKSDLKIYDISGKEIFEQEIHSSAENVDVSQLSSGLYFYGIFQEGRRVKTGKLVKE